MILIGGSMAADITCPEVNENSTVGELNMAWICDLMKWRDALAGLKKRVEQECPVTDEDDYWRSVFECPDFSAINCSDVTPPENKTDLFNCSISYCENGHYSDDTFLRKIWLHQFKTNRKFMIAYKNNLSHCIQSAGSTIDTYMTKCPDVDVNSTSTEMSIAWMCELMKWRNILGEWKQAVEEDCSVNEKQPEWRTTFECPDFSEIACADGQPLQNNSDSLDCPINSCSNGEYADATILQKISGAQIDIYENAIVSTSNLTCEPRKYSESLSTTQDVSESIAESTTDPTAAMEVATDFLTESTTATDMLDSTDGSQSTVGAATTIRPTINIGNLASPASLSTPRSVSEYITEFTDSTLTAKVTTDLLIESTNDAITEVPDPTVGSTSTVGVMALALDPTTTTDAAASTESLSIIRAGSESETDTTDSTFTTEATTDLLIESTTAITDVSDSTVDSTSTAGVATLAVDSTASTDDAASTESLSTIRSVNESIMVSTSRDLTNITTDFLTESTTAIDHVPDSPDDSKSTVGAATTINPNDAATSIESISRTQAVSKSITESATDLTHVTKVGNNVLTESTTAIDMSDSTDD